MLYSYVPLPLTPAIVKVPLLPPLQVTSVELVILHSGALGAVTVTPQRLSQLFPSRTVIVCIPADKPVKVLLAWKGPLLMLYK